MSGLERAGERSGEGMIGTQAHSVPHAAQADEIEAFGGCAKSSDFAEDLSAFVQNRVPAFTNR